MNLNDLSDEDMRELTGFIALQAKEDAELFDRKRIDSEEKVALIKADDSTTAVTSK